MNIVQPLEPQPFGGILHLLHLQCFFISGLYYVSGGLTLPRNDSVWCPTALATRTEVRPSPSVSCARTWSIEKPWQLTPPLFLVLNLVHVPHPLEGFSLDISAVPLSTK